MSSLEYNDFSAQCVVGACLNQVAGYLDRNPAAQLSACESLFGFPVVPTVTSPADAILSTEIATLTYTEIYVSTSTEYSTLEEISTSYANVLETATEYTTTLVDIITTTVPAAVTSQAPLKRRDHGRRACIPKVSSSLTASSPSFATSSSAAPFPLASACPNLAEYSSACACLEPTTTATEFDDAATSVIQQTESATVESTVETVVTVAVTTVVVKPATTTLTSTLTTLTATTTTATSTSTPSSTVPQKFGLVMSNGPNAGNSAIILGAAPAFLFTRSTSASPAQLGLTSAGTTPFLSENPTYQMYLRMIASSYGAIFFTTPAYVVSTSSTWAVVTCLLDPDTLIMGCSASNGFTRFVQCGIYIYMANPTTTPGGCIEVQLQVASS